MLNTIEHHEAYVEAGPSMELLVSAEISENYSFYVRLALGRSRNPADAADIVQSFAVKALERAEQLKDPRAIRSWLRRVFETSVIDFFRRNSRIRHREVPIDGTNPAMDDAVSPPSFNEETQLIRATMACLKSDYAEIICRFDLQDQSSEEIADDLGITLNNTSVRLHRARAAFRIALDERPIQAVQSQSHPHCSARSECHQAKCPLEEGWCPPSPPAQARSVAARYQVC